MSNNMSADFHASNPFRRKATAPSATAGSVDTSRHDAAPQPTSSLPTTDLDLTEQTKAHTKPVKKVRVQSPPPLSPEGDSLSPKPLTPIPQYDEILNDSVDPFESTASESSENSDDDTVTANNKYIPPNPFHKTLATLEHTEGGAATSRIQSSTLAGPSAGRASLDVDAFKRLLMTGSADAVTPGLNKTPPVHIGHLGLTDGGNSTDASSSASRQSIFEPIQEIHPESPRTSHEISDPDDERRRYNADGLIPSDRRKPPPPSSRHGKLIKVELKDENSTASDNLPTAGSRAVQQPSSSSGSIRSFRSPTDLNKPLPAAPSRASHESDRESIFDKEAAGRTPEPPSPPPSQVKKTPPAPPLSRRHSQMVSESKMNRMSSIKLSPSIEVEGPNITSPEISTIPSVTTKAPPPPPSRRPASIRNLSHQVSLSSLGPPPVAEQQRPRSNTGSAAPAPPPARMPSSRLAGRPASVLSMDLPSKRASTAPPPPPPRQRASSRTSIDAPFMSSSSSRRTSSDFYRKSIESTHDEALAPMPDASKRPGDVAGPPVGAIDILADLTALQREVDALRGQFETRGPV